MKRGLRYRQIIVSLIGIAAGIVIVIQHGVVLPVSANDLNRRVTPGIVRDGVFVRLTDVRSVEYAPYRVSIGDSESSTPNLSSTRPSLLIIAETSGSTVGLLVSKADPKVSDIDVRRIEGRLTLIADDAPGATIDPRSDRRIAYAILTDEPRLTAWLLIGVGILVWGFNLLLIAIRGRSRPDETNAGVDPSPSV